MAAEICRLIFALLNTNRVHFIFTFRWYNIIVKIELQKHLFYIL